MAHFLTLKTRGRFHGHFVGSWPGLAQREQVFPVSFRCLPGFPDWGTDLDTDAL